jgi:hypothetical protein
MSTARELFLGDVVTRPGDKAKGIVVAVIGRAYAVVKWPSTAWSKHHQKDLRRVC